MLLEKNLNLKINKKKYLLQACLTRFEFIEHTIECKCLALASTMISSEHMSSLEELSQSALTVRQR